MSGLIPAPAPGVYAGIPAEEYHAWDALNNTALGFLEQSPTEFLDYVAGDLTIDTEALRLGRALHEAVLEPDRFSTDGLTRSGATRVAGMREALLTKARLTDAIREAGDECELSIVWEEDGLLMKARYDLPLPGVRGIVDLKTSWSPAPGPFGRSLDHFGYDRQAAHYLAGAHALWGPDVIRQFAFVVVGSRAPHDVKVYTHHVGSDLIERGRERRSHLLQRYRACMERGEWPTRDDMIGGLTAWEFEALKSEELVVA